MKLKITVICLLGFLVLLLGSAPAPAQQYEQIVVATGSPFELGLIDALAKVFEKETGCIVRCIKTPTGPGLEPILGPFPTGGTLFCFRKK